MKNKSQKFKNFLGYTFLIAVTIGPVAIGLIVPNPRHAFAVATLSEV